MKSILLDLIWPAVYVKETFSKFWFLVIGTIILETLVVKYFLKFEWTKSFSISLIGNSVSGIIGTFVMAWVMLFWHYAVDSFLPHATFDNINWYATFILMCFGSVLLEILAVRIVFKVSIKRLFLPMLTGNLLSYTFIAFAMITATDKDPDQARVEKLKYLPDKVHFVLLDSSTMEIDTSTIIISYDKDNNRLNDSKSLGYTLTIPFHKQFKNSFQFDFTILGEEFCGGIFENLKEFHYDDLKEIYKILLLQKNPDKAIGWIKPIITDTLTFTLLSKPK